MDSLIQKIINTLSKRFWCIKDTWVIVMYDSNKLVMFQKFASKEDAEFHARKQKYCIGESPDGVQIKKLSYHFHWFPL